jgi:hypothetical protein
MNLPIKKILACVQSGQSAEAVLPQLVAIGKQAKKSPLWDQLPAIDTNADVDEAADWLRSQLKTKTITGVFLGLGGADDDADSNVEIGWTSKADPASEQTDWAYDLSKRGKPHLIRGLSKLRETWAALEDEDLQFVFDYTLTLGYSGAVLAEALSQEQLQSHTHYVWGFHDGDFCSLARWSPSGFERLAKTPKGE